MFFKLTRTGLSHTSTLKFVAAERKTPGVQRKEEMVDRVYKAGLPKLKHSFEKLREEFSKLDPETDWTNLRIEPLLKHIDTLEQLLYSPEFSQEFSRLRKGVRMFHSDLSYFRENVKELQKLLRSEKRR